MRLPEVILLGVLAQALFSSAFKFNSIQEYLQTFDLVETTEADVNVTHVKHPPKESPPSLFKISPLLSMFPGSQPHVDHNKTDVGEPLFLTPLIENGELEKAKNLSKLDPNFSDIASYTGFFTVNKKYNSNLFFWYVPAQVIYIFNIVLL